MPCPQRPHVYAYSDTSTVLLPWIIASPWWLLRNFQAAESHVNTRGKVSRTTRRLTRLKIASWVLVLAATSSRHSTQCIAAAPRPAHRHSSSELADSWCKANSIRFHGYTTCKYNTPPHAAIGQLIRKRLQVRGHNIDHSNRAKFHHQHPPLQHFYFLLTVTSICFPRAQVKCK